MKRSDTQPFRRLSNLTDGAFASNTATWTNALISTCAAAQVTTIVIGYTPVGSTATALSQASPDLDAAGIAVRQLQRALDTTAWPQATKRFFKMKKEVPSVLNQLEFS